MSAVTSATLPPERTRTLFRSLRTRVARTMIAVGLLMSLVTTTLLLVQTYLAEREAAEQRLNDIERSASTALAAALWPVDREGIESLLDSFAQRTGVRQVELVTASGERWTRGAAVESPWLQRRVRLQHADGDRFDIGELRVVIGYQYLVDRMLAQLVLVGGIVVSGALAASLLLYLLLQRWVTRPLEAVSGYASELHEQQLTSPLQLPARHPEGVEDEIDQLADALNAMRERLHRNLQQRARQADELRAYQGDLEALVRKRTAELSERIKELAVAKAQLESAKSAAEAAADRFADFAEISADGFWETDADLQLTLISENFARLLGAESEQMIGLTPEAAYRKRFPQAPDLAPYMAPLRDRQPFKDQRLQLRDRDGVRRWVLNHGQPFFGERGRFLGFRGAVTDVTAEVEAERALMASERRFRLITDNVPAMIAYIDRERVFRFNNRVYGEWLRKPLDQITGRRLADVYDAPTFALIEPQLDAAFSGQRVSFDLELAGRCYRATYVPDIDDSGVAIGIYGLIHDITRLKRIEEELRVAAMVDPLTGLPNRRRFEQVLQRAIDRAERDARPMALIFIDVDYFKSINDTLGHDAGDLLLKAIAQRLRNAVRSTDTAARLGGDEFVVVLEALAGPDEAGQVAAKILQSVAEPVDLDGQLRRPSVSMGVAMHALGEPDATQLLRRADSALYAAKAAGRGCFRIADADAA